MGPPLGPPAPRNVISATYDPAVSVFDSLPVGMAGSKARPGYRATQYTNLPGKSLDETVQMVEAVGGRVASKAHESSSQRPGRMFARVEQVRWLELPESAFED